MDGTTTCPLCGVTYVHTLPDDRQWHARLHARAVRAARVFAHDNPGLPPLPLYYEAREAMKERADEVMEEEEARGVDTGVGLAIVLAHFARSWEQTNYSPRHPSFERYARGAMAGPYAREDYGEALIRRFPPEPLPGLAPSGHWQPERARRQKGGAP
jgi:hypothetical protein